MTIAVVREGLAADHPVPDPLEASARVAVPHSPLDEQIDTTEIVNHGLEALEARDDVVVNGQSGEIADGRSHKVGSAQRQCIGDLPGPPTRYRHPRVAR